MGCAASTAPDHHARIEEISKSGLLPSLGLTRVDCGHVLSAYDKLEELYDSFPLTNYQLQKSLFSLDGLENDLQKLNSDRKNPKNVPSKGCDNWASMWAATQQVDASMNGLRIIDTHNISEGVKTKAFHILSSIQFLRLLKKHGLGKATRQKKRQGKTSKVDFEIPYELFVAFSVNICSVASRDIEKLAFFISADKISKSKKGKCAISEDRLTDMVPQLLVFQLQRGFFLKNNVSHALYCALDLS